MRAGLGYTHGIMRAPRSNADASRLVSGFHFRGKLPHLKREGLAYFLTFRLADSLPREAVLKLKHERETVIQTAMAAKRPWTWQEEKQLFIWYSERVEQFLDAGAGVCWLRRPEIADLVAEALNFFDGDRYDLYAWTVMPNHVHVVVWPRPGQTLSSIEHSWKSFTASQTSKMLGRVGRHFWQKETYDHLIRNEQERSRLCAYVADNPVKAGLCARPEEWLWCNVSLRAERLQRKSDIT
ncbi:MAG TPA: transposase [Candidatus Acidoferrum sp.]|nr:transposase [Candidatus Acidoferrum sp.]